MSRYQRPADQARSALLEATVVAATIDAALAALDRGLAGYPTSTPGAGPASLPSSDDSSGDSSEDSSDDGLLSSLEPGELGHLPGETYTTVERNATQRDKARSDLALLLRSLDAISRHVACAAGVTHRWAFAGIDATTVKAQLVSIDQGIWCQHCSTFGRHEPRKSGYLNCDWCVAFQQRYKQLPPKEIWDARDARDGRIDLTTITRILANIRTDRKTAESARRAAARLAKLAG